MSIRWGIMGTANILTYGTIPGMKIADNCEIYAIAGRSEQKVKDFCQRYDIKIGYVGYDKLLEDPNIDAVYIPLPNNIHKEWVIKALKAGKHVLCEKPLALNCAEAEEMFKVAKENNVILMEAYAYLHSEYMKALIEDVNSGIIGDVVYVDTAFLTQGYAEDFRLHKELGGGMVYDLGCYCTTMILSLIDSEISYVKADAEMTDEGVDSFVGVLLKFENGARASFNVGMILGIGSDSRYDRLFIHGTKGDIRSEVYYNQDGDVSYKIIKGGETIIRNVHVNQNYKLEIEDMNNAIMNNVPTEISPEFSLKNARLIDDILCKIGY
ncbi:MAG: Gfo/Idh/MocA family oxidoreductase [Clostridiales bacterium]|nr:Gfo/Idh/MocA family oxidoreductase [Clostridiales bacterium]